MKIGVIGLGNIGRMLVKRFAEAITPSDIIVFDIHKTRKNKYSLAKSAQEVVDKSEIVFLCIRPQDLKDFFSNVKPKNRIIISTVAAIFEKTYYKQLGKIKLIRIIPSMINKIGVLHQNLLKNKVERYDKKESNLNYRFIWYDW